MPSWERTRWLPPRRPACLSFGGLKDAPVIPCTVRDDGGLVLLALALNELSFVLYISSGVLTIKFE